MSETKFLDNLASCFEKLPGVGKKQPKDMLIILLKKCL